MEVGDLSVLSVYSGRVMSSGIHGQKQSLAQIDEILKERKTKWQKPKPKYTKGALGIYTRLAVSPMKGGYIE